MDNVREQILNAAIQKYGRGTQQFKAIEELSELIRALARFDDENIAEEMADCYIMLAQLELIYGNHGDVVQMIREKMARTLERVEAERRGEGT